MTEFDRFQSSGDVHSTFVVRIYSSDGSDVIRGQVQHVQSRQHTDFANRERLLSFIQDHWCEDAEADR